MKSKIYFSEYDVAEMVFPIPNKGRGLGLNSPSGPSFKGSSPDKYAQNKFPFSLFRKIE